MEGLKATVTKTVLLYLERESIFCKMLDKKVELYGDSIVPIISKLIST